MIKLAFIFSTFFAISSVAMANTNLDHVSPECDYLELNEHQLRALLFNTNCSDCVTALGWEADQLVELEEHVEIGFNTKDYLPPGFNPLQGLHDLDWNKIELYEVDEDIELGFDTKNYLPKNFSPYKEIC